MPLAHTARNATAAGIRPARIAGNNPPSSAIATPHASPIEASDAPWLAGYDATGAPLLSSGSYAGKAPVLPVGVLESARRPGGHRLSWQPRAGVRPVGFLDDDKSRHGTTVAGLRIYGSVESLADAVAATGAARLLITMPDATGV